VTHSHRRRVFGFGDVRFSDGPAATFGKFQSFLRLRHSCQSLRTQDPKIGCSKCLRGGRFSCQWQVLTPPPPPPRISGLPRMHLLRRAPERGRPLSVCNTISLGACFPIRQTKILRAAAPEDPHWYFCSKGWQETFSLPLSLSGENAEIA